jgi:anhydro-N-acetylmuramic acid kinase
MTKKAKFTAIGLMSGTSLDGIDAALLVGDGEKVDQLGATLYQPYSPEQVSQLQKLLTGAAQEGRDYASNDEYAAVRRAFTLAHAEAVAQLLGDNGLNAAGIDLLGFHGQTILHRPAEGWTWQMSDGALLAKETGIAVIDDFRSADVAAGGQGAPFAPLYHQALLNYPDVKPQKYPITILNIGGISNLTWVSGNGDVIGFDTGPGNAQLNDWVGQHCGQPFDLDGLIAAAGQVDAHIVDQVLQSDYFSAPYPKSLDRQDFDLTAVQGLSPGDGAATLTAITVRGIVLALRQLPALPKAIYVCGGGRKNLYLMKVLEKVSQIRTEPVEVLGWRGDFLEAECFAHLAIRSAQGMPLSLPTTTGAKAAVTGGVLHRP